MIVAVGDLMSGHPEISELDLNPVLVGATTSIAVDWRILVG
jgi:acetyltransferase